MNKDRSSENIGSKKIQAILQMIAAKKNGILSSIESLDIREKIIAARKEKIEAIVGEINGNKGKEFCDVNQACASKRESYKTILKRLDEERNAIAFEREQLNRLLEELNAKEQKIR